MPSVARKGDLCQGHDACPPRSATEGESTVTVKGKPLLLQGHRYPKHGCSSHAPHTGVVKAGAPRVSCKGKQIARVGDPITCGPATTAVAQGEQTVTIGD